LQICLNRIFFNKTLFAIGKIDLQNIPKYTEKKKTIFSVCFGAKLNYIYFYMLYIIGYIWTIINVYIALFVFGYA